MRSIPESLKNKCKLLAQNKDHNADPRLEAIIKRREIPIPHYNYWQTSQVADFTGRVSIAVARPDYRRIPERIFVAGINNGEAKIYSAPFDGINAPTIWSEILTIPDAVEISIAFVGRFMPYKRGRTEFYTADPYPWIFWVDSDGMLNAQYWDNESTLVQLGQNVTSCSATMGTNSVQGEWGQGLIVAWTTEAGSLFYAQYYQGVWNDGIIVPQAPSDLVEVTISRPADYRIIMLVKTTGGSVTALFFRSIAQRMTSWDNQINLVSAGVTSASLIPLTYSVGYTRENIEITSIDQELKLGRDSIPIPIRAFNVDDGTGDYGRFVIIQFDTQVYNFENHEACFTTLEGYTCLGTTRRVGDGHDLLCLELIDFNDLVGTMTIVYTPGTMDSGYDNTTDVLAFQLTFTPTGLVPNNTPGPVIVDIVNAEGVDPNA